MKQANIGDGQRVSKEVFNQSQDAKTNAILERMVDTHLQGILRGALNEFTIISGTGIYQVIVRTGVAYGPGMERIIVAAENVTYDSTKPATMTTDGIGGFVNTPQSTGSKDISLTAGFVNYLYIRYLATIDPARYTLHRILSARQFYVVDDGYEIVFNTTGVNPDATQYLYLGQVDLTGGKTAISANISVSGRDLFGKDPDRVRVTNVLISKADRTPVYLYGESYTLKDHIKAVGGGSVSQNNPHGMAPEDIGISSLQTFAAHARIQHTNGLIGDYAATLSMMKPTRVDVAPHPPSDYVIIRSLLTTEYLFINGILFTSVDFPLVTNVLFTAGGAGTYYIYVDSVTRTIEKTTAAGVLTDVTKYVLCSVSWDGTADLTALVDLRVFNTFGEVNIWTTAGRPTTGLRVGRIGYNLTTHKYEGYKEAPAGWVDLS